MLPALDITVYPLQTSLPYHILLLLLTAESPEVCNSNLIGSNFLFALKLSLQVWWICCCIRQLIREIHCTYLIHFTHSLLPNWIASCILLVFSFVHLCTVVEVFQIIALFSFSILYFLLVSLSCISCLVLHCSWALFACVLLVLCVLFAL